MKTRQEHLDWCKKRALEYVEEGEITNAFSSMSSDLSKHEDTEDHPGVKLGLSLLFNGSLSTSDEMRKYINGFN